MEMSTRWHLGFWMAGDGSMFMLLSTEGFLCASNSRAVKWCGCSITLAFIHPVSGCGKLKMGS